METNTIYTIGHSNHSVDTFISLLRKYDISAVADVRSHPYSRHLPHFNRRELGHCLRTIGVRYVFLGRELGARPDDPACYVKGKALYDKIANTLSFQEGLQRLRTGMLDWKIALLCAEKEPVTCHRTILVCRHLREPHVAIEHILGDGNLESHALLEQRLIELHGLQQGNLLDTLSTVDPLEEAYDRQAYAIAYTRAEKKNDKYVLA